MNVNERIKEIRKRDGLSLEKLAELTGFTKGYLSRIENSSKVPPFATVQAIAEALQTDIMLLLDKGAHPVGSKNIDLMRNPENNEEAWEESSLVYSFIPLVNTYKNKYMSPFMFKVKKGETELTSHDSEEFVLVLDGEVDLNYEGRTYSIARGDSFYLDARIKHNFVNKNEKTASLLAVHFNYRRF
jgi:Predicted transcriptional regulator with C-terminal CBS domains